VSLAVVPPLLLVVLSIPPLASAFIDRYVMYAQAALAVLVALSLAAVWPRKKLFWQKGTRLSWLAAGVLVVGLVAGIGNVYYYGNYNKNSSTSVRVKEVMQAIETTDSANYPVIAQTPWIYYEAAFYETEDRPVYFVDEWTGYDFGSLAMLEQSDMGKIKDLGQFTGDNRYVWLLGYRLDEPLEAPVDTWTAVEDVAGYDTIDDNSKYRATLFDTSAE
jgi:hypothetical protein